MIQQGLSKTELNGLTLQPEIYPLLAFALYASSPCPPKCTSQEPVDNPILSQLDKTYLNRTYLIIFCSIYNKIKYWISVGRLSSTIGSRIVGINGSFGTMTIG